MELKRPSSLPDLGNDAHPDYLASEAERERKWNLWQDELGQRRAAEPEIQKLLASPEWKEARALLAKHSVVDSHPLKFGFEVNIFGAILEALKGPTLTQRMTRKERQNHADKIIQAAAKFTELMKPIYEDRRLPWQFQTEFDYLALLCTLDFNDTLVDAGAEEMTEDEIGRARFCVNHLLSKGMPETMQIISMAAKDWADEAQFLAKPNDPNANRLYFIRRLTSSFENQYKKPMRTATLLITSVYFNCEDIDEAALSRLAPVSKTPKK